MDLPRPEWTEKYLIRPFGTQPKCETAVFPFKIVIEGRGRAGAVTATVTVCKKIIKRQFEEKNICCQ